jgi:valyl-tRNA synthetase
MGLKFMDGAVPFREVYIHGLVRDSHGQKMSKSKGNVLDPIDLIDGIELEALVKKRTSGMMQPQLAKKIEKQTRADFPAGIPAFGTDALRFTFAALATTGRDINFDLGRVEGYRNFCNKLWNASRYVLMNTEGQDCDQANSGQFELSTVDQWISARFQQVAAETRDAIDGYRLDHAAQAIYSFLWDEYCDWYLELTKPVLTSDASSAEQKRGTRRTLVRTLEATLRLLHPLMPYITEEIWQRVAPLAGKSGDAQGRASVAGGTSPRMGEGRTTQEQLSRMPGATKTIMTQPYPQAGEANIDQAAIDEMEWVKTFILGVRQIRSSLDIKPGKPLPVLLQNASSDDRARLSRNRNYIDFLARTESITVLGAGEQAPESATALVGEMKVLIPMAGLIDVAAEVARLTKEIDKARAEVQRVEAKLANPAFVDKAPEAVVQKERDKIAATNSALASLQQQLERIRKM